MLELSQIRLSWGESRLAGVSVSAEAGARVMVLGPSGAGKSTLLKIIAGLEAPGGGEVRLDGRALGAVAPEQRGIVYMAQRGGLLEWLNIEENVSFGLKMRGVDAATRAERAREVLRAVGLEGFERRMPATLSGGQAQRVALARALAVKPRVLLLDEPLSSLDAPLKRQLTELIIALQQSHGFMLWWVTHDAALALTEGTQLVLMAEGALVAAGSPASIWRRRHEDDRVASILDVNALDAWTQWTQRMRA